MDDEATVFVPEGQSIWEIGTDQNPKGKAERDYTKRSETTDPNATFIFSTTREFGDKDAWCMAKREEGRWKDVRAYDALSYYQIHKPGPYVVQSTAGVVSTAPFIQVSLKEGYEVACAHDSDEAGKKAYACRDNRIFRELPPDYATDWNEALNSHFMCADVDPTISCRDNMSMY